MEASINNEIQPICYSLKEHPFLDYLAVEENA